MGKKKDRNKASQTAGNSLMITKGNSVMRNIPIPPPRFNNPQHQALLNMIYDSQPEMVQGLVNHLFEAGWYGRGKYQDMVDEIENAYNEDFYILRTHCYEIDIVVRLQVSKNDLQLTLKKKHNAIESALTDVKNGWAILRQINIDVGLPDPDSFDMNRPDVIADVNIRLTALKALCGENSDDKPIRAIPPLKLDIGETLAPTGKKGRTPKSKKNDWLRKQWQDYERQHTTAKPFDVRLAMLELVATGDGFKNPYQPKPNLNENERAAYFSLMSHTAQADVSAYRYDLLERDTAKSRKN